jgi:hypothetical protein
LITAADRGRQSTELNRIGHYLAVAYQQKAADSVDVWIVQSLGADFGTIPLGSPIEIPRS